MRTVVIGAGAVGCYFGGLLARAGHPVTLVGRPRHVQAIESHGLKLEVRGRSEFIKVDASASADSAAQADWVLICAKSTDNADIGKQLRPLLRPECTVLSLQNGVDSAQQLEPLLGRPVIPVAVYVAVEMAGNGHVRHHGRGELEIGAFERAPELASFLASAGIPTVIADNIRSVLWTKFVINCVYNALSALSQLPYGQLMQQAGMWDCARDIVRECEAVATADGIALPEDLWHRVEAIAASMAGQTSSTAHDLAAARRTEIDSLNGHIATRGAILGIATPANRLLWNLVRLQQAQCIAAQT